MTKAKKTVIRFFHLLEEFATDLTVFESVLHSEFVQTEYPNLLTRQTRNRDLAACALGLQSAKNILAHQKFEPTQFTGDDERLAVELVWTAKMAVDAGNLAKGQTLKANICIVFEFRNGRIYRQRNFDCYEPWN